MASSLVVWVVLLHFTVVTGDNCRVKSPFNSNKYVYRYCQKGCCSSLFDNACCDEPSLAADDTDSVSRIAWNVVLVFGIIVAVSIVVSLIKCCCKRTLYPREPRMVTNIGTLNRAYTRSPTAHSGNPPAIRRHSASHQHQTPHNPGNQNNPPTYDMCAPPPSYDDVIKNAPPP